jgi:hypothetical protein
MNEAIVEALAAESSCLPAQFLDGKVRIGTLSPDRAANPARRRFEIADPSLQIFTLGTGGVVSASDEWQPWVEDLFEGVDRDGLFEPKRLGEIARRVEPAGALVFGPIPRFVTSSEDIRSADAPSGYSIEVTGPEIWEPLERELFPNALGRRDVAARPNMLTAIGRHEGEIVGLATAALHSDMLWQIGVDVVRAHRRRGLAAAVTSALGRAVLERGAVPYYGTSSSNVPSMLTALGAGFRPGWVEVFTLREELARQSTLTLGER